MRSPVYPIISLITFCLATQPLALAIPYPAPVISMEIDPDEQSIDATTVDSSLVDFVVQVQVTKLPRQQVTATLTATVNVGWSCTLTPEILEFDALRTDDANFSHCCVTVPTGVANVTGTLTVNVSAMSGGLATNTFCTAKLIVRPSTAPSANNTGNSGNPEAISAGVVTNSPGNATFNGFWMSLFSNKFVLYGTVISVVLVTVMISGLVYVGKKRRRNLDC